VTASMRFGVLGVLTATRGGHPVHLGGRQARVVLAMLLSQPNRPVSADTLIDAVWGQAPPRTAAKNLQVYIHGLRRVVGETRIVRDAHGYRIDVSRDEVDSTVAEDLIAEGRSAIAAGDTTVGRKLLATALDQWRGAALADVSDVDRLRPTIVRLTELRLSALEDLIHATLVLGEHREAATAAGECLVESPMRERLRGLHITALYRSGRPADAIASYHEGREALSEELGLSPSEPLQQAYLAIVRGHDPGRYLGIAIASAADGPTVAQLPPDVVHFTGRDTELAEMDAWAVRAGESAPLLITGGPGVGKTALAVHWGHRWTDRTGADHLYVNLRGYSADPPMLPIDALTSLLRSLGVTPAQIPVDVPMAAAVYRSTVANRQLLVVLDNADHADQVRDLLPGGRGVLVIVTSRQRLAGVVARDGAHRITLGPLPGPDAVALLARMAGPEVAAAPKHAAELARLCGHLPLALRVVAANLTDGRHTTVEAMVTEVQDAVWPAALDLDDDAGAGPRAAFDHSYHRLDAAGQRLFRLTSTIPGPDFSPAAAAATAAAEVDGDLRRLMRAHLIEPTPGGRFAMHDLLHRYALGVCESVEPLSARLAARRRLYAHYLRHCAAAAQVAYPQMLRLPGGPDAEPSLFASNADAIAWLDAERPSLLAAIATADDDGEPETAWRLADTMRGYFGIRLLMSDWLTAAELALRLAEEAGDIAAQIAGRLSVATARWWLDRDPAAITLLTHAVDLAEEIGWAEGAVASLSNLGLFYGDSGLPERAMDCYTRALDLQPPAGLAGNIRVNLGDLARSNGRLDDAVRHTTTAMDLFSTSDMALGAAVAQLTLVEALLAQGDLAAAREHLVAVLSALRVLPDRLAEACALANLGMLEFECGNTEAATDAVTAAMTLIVEVDGQRFLPVVYTVQGLIAADPKRHEEAIRLARECPGDFSECEAMFWSATTLLRLGEHERAAAACTDVLAAAGDGRFRHLAAMAMAVQAEVHAATGDMAAARTTASQALSALTESGCIRYRERMRLLISPS